MGNRQVTLAQRPIGMVNESTTSLIDSPIPECAVGEALIKVGLLSIDPTIRTWMNDAPGYLPPIGIGDVIRSGGSGVVVESRTERYHVGDVVNGMTGWQEWAIASETNRFTVLPKGLGLLDVGAFQEGDVVVVSGAAGATGSVVGQIAKARGASRVVGIAGGAQKCAEVVERYGFDECLDYREAGLTSRIHEACPKGIDLYFDNVGGEVLDAALANIAMHARIVMCGAISQYNATDRSGVANTSMLIVRRGQMKGFIVFDFAHRYAEAHLELATMVLDGRIAHQEHLVSGLEHAPDALNLLFTGGNHGKTLVVVDDSVQLV